MVDGVASELPGPGRLAFTMFALFMDMFTSNLDSIILANANPYITNEYHSIDDIGWYGSVRFLTLAALQTTWGKVFKYFPLKSSYRLSLIIVEVVSLICAIAPNSGTLIVGRAIAGIGGAGLCTGTFVIIGYTVAQEHQPAFKGVMGAT
ncbi:Major facilitator superfamily domain general substrate transporter [Penicillium soppii]|jgi:MFS family permease|uniref:Major facilitator superfamily domain general substrate transporter n=1 Tax=Penicillium soppii TaxID=69789 RepID=UPI00254701FF|nr:Major facilitator superfamily domain general substrate transporter [Penicillium soppii]KAJ5873064.1 Major facilitator superfamily domain general substrate transporter [Penicillium soppii]